MPTVGTSSRGHRLRARNLVDDMDLRRSAAIAIGATAGAGIRWALTRALGPGAVDVSLLTVNLVGAMLLGALTGARPGSVSARTQGLIGAGLCGGSPPGPHSLCTPPPSTERDRGSRHRPGSSPTSSAEQRWL
ncbi:MAG: hypothetical protein M5U19_03095 [Microthrixaceae bacterium]|nr:hypothetical protein [Microthrixaceae bacterium]